MTVDGWSAEAPDAQSSEGNRRLHRGALAVGGGFAIKFGARISFLLVAAVLYGATLYGAYSVALAIVEVSITIGGAGMKTMLFQILENTEHSTSPGDRLLETGLIVVGVSALVTTLIVSCILLLPGLGLVGWTLLWMAPLITGQALLDLLLAATRWQGLVRYEVLCRSIIEPYVAVLISVVAFWFGAPQFGLVIGYAAGTLAAIVVALSAVLRSFNMRGVTIRPSDFQQLFSTMRHNSWVTGTDCVTALAERADLYIVGLMLGDAPAGVYGVARQVCTPLRQVRQSFDALLTPIVARELRLSGLGPARRTIAGVSRKILDLQLPTFLLIAGMGAAILRLLGGYYPAAYAPMLILCLAEILQASFGIADLLFAYRAPGHGLLVTVAGAVIGIVASFLLASFGMVGIASGLLLGYIARALIRRRMIHLLFAVSSPLRPLIPTAIAFAAGGAVVLIAVEISYLTSLVPAIFFTAVAVAIFFTTRNFVERGFHLRMV
ncbi:lipopolysaccharide biosynthesis protein [Sphingomonas sp. TDK1]|uniref:lipopolysaccharide biosynthesis protein n=1 Tax=Sphingomonas sp. TDK1 TaxID=453247 RepID=UPI0009FF65F2|nr:oligosaccharide flippase family protein [Sphingomonas sp. TDK1]